MKVSDEMLMAYVDGELDAEGVAVVERAMREEPDVAAAVARARSLRERMRQAYAPVLSEPVPERLLAAVGGVNAAGGKGTVVPLRAAAAARAQHQRWRWPEWTALAASLALGVLVAPWLRPDGPQAPLRMSDRGLVASGELAKALDSRLSAEAEGAGQSLVKVGLSFREQDGRYCRTFVLDRPQAVAGLACRDAGQWHVPALGEATPAGGELRLASTPLPPAVLAEVDARLDGEPLDASGEREARDAGWK